jgi:hypothetical protein
MSEPKKNSLSVFALVSAFQTAAGEAFTVVFTCEA